MSRGDLGASPKGALYSRDLETCVRCGTVGATAGPVRDRMVQIPSGPGQPMGWRCRRSDWCARQAAARGVVKMEWPPEAVMELERLGTKFEARWPPVIVVGVDLKRRSGVRRKR